MIVFKVGYIILRLCENDEYDEICSEILQEISDDKIKDLAIELFNNTKIDASTLAAIKVPDIIQNDHVDTFLKAIQTAQKLKSNIIITEQPHFINHSEINE